MLCLLTQVTVPRSLECESMQTKEDDDFELNNYSLSSQKPASLFLLFRECFPLLASKPSHTSSFWCQHTPGQSHAGVHTGGGGRPGISPKAVSPPPRKFS